MQEPRVDCAFGKNACDRFLRTDRPATARQTAKVDFIATIVNIGAFTPIGEVGLPRYGCGPIAGRIEYRIEYISPEAPFSLQMHEIFRSTASVEVS